MTLMPSFPGPSGLTTSTAARAGLAALIVRDKAGNPRAGVARRSNAAIVTGRSDLNVNVAAFEAVAVQFGGTVFLANDAVAQLPANLISPISGSNYYVVYAKQNESEAPGIDADNTVFLGSVVSSTSVEVARGLLPVGAIELATVEVPASATATNSGGVIISQTAKFTATTGGVIPFRTTTEMNAWDAEVGQLGEVGGVLYRRTGTGWSKITDDTGWVSISTFGTGWSATSGYAPRVRRVGPVVYLHGAVTRGSGASGGDLLTIPSGFRQSATPFAQYFLGASVTSGNRKVQPMLDSGFKIQLAYGDVTAAGEVVPLDGFWFVE